MKRSRAWPAITGHNIIILRTGAVGMRGQWRINIDTCMACVLMGSPPPPHASCLGLVTHEEAGVD